MNANILIDELPVTVLINGKPWPVDWGYRAMMLIEICMFDPDRSDEQRMLDALNLFYMENIPPDVEEAVRWLLWFHRCGREAKTESEDKGKGRKKQPKRQAGGHTKRCYCFEQDAPYIYAAFRTQYGINLNHTGNRELHWWEFSAMFESLNEDLKISRIIYYRTVKVSGMGAEQRRFINEMKKLYALSDRDSSMDDQMKLVRRNQEMKDYVRRRASGNV